MFKNMIAADLAVFINSAEFGEKVNIDGDEIDVVIDNDIINDRPRLYSSGTDMIAEGVFRSMITFFVKSEDLGYTPVEDQQLNFNGELYTVKSVSDNAGIFELTIEANRS